MRRRLVFASLVSSTLGAVLALGVGRADPPPAPAEAGRRRYSLTEMLALAEQSYPGLAAGRHKIGAARAQLSEAWAAPFFPVTVTGFASLSPQARGNPTFSPDAFGQSPLEGETSVLYRLNAEAGVPISPWSWVRIGRARDAARAGIRAAEGEQARGRLELRTNVRRAYYGIQLARDSEYLLRQGEGYLETATRYLREGLDAGGEGYSAGDEFQLESLRGELEARHAETEQGEGNARYVLGMLTGVGEGLDVVDEPLCPNEVTLGPLAHYLTAARLHRPEVGMLQAGVAARRAAVDIQRWGLLPDLALGLTAAVSSAPTIAEQANPFAANNNNYAYWATGLVLRWQFEPVTNAFRIQRLSEELAMTEAQQRLALGGIGVEVQEVYRRVLAGQRREAAYGRAERAAYAWLTTKFQEYQSGGGDITAVTNPLRQYFQSRFSHLQAIHDLNVALAQLALATGTESVAGAPGRCDAPPAGPEGNAGGGGDDGPTEDEIRALMNAPLDAGAAADAGTPGAAADAGVRRPTAPRR